MDRKKIIYLAIVGVLFLLSGCANKDIVMDLPAEDGKFYYSNKDLEFSVVLPAEFIYYQTQRKEVKDYVDIEFFVPTSDVDYKQEIPGYAKPVVLRVFNEDAWQNLVNNMVEDNIIYQKVKEKNDKVYTIKFWEEVPSDWKDKWNKDIREEIIKKISIK